nr:putative alpha amylase [uncultured Mediterranean phage uvMED]
MSTVKAANLQNTGSGAPAFKNSSGTEIGQLAKAWVNFNGTGTVAIRDSFNVASITDNGTGDYTMNLTNAMANVNYAITGTVGTIGSTGASDLFLGGGRQTNYSDLRTTGAARFASTNAAGAAEDGAIVSLVVFGD